MRSEQLTLAEKELIERELREALDTLIAGCEKRSPFLKPASAL
ncbi:MAG: hypothetical protein P8Z34_13105 [Anaerolineales bacterium]